MKSKKLNASFAEIWCARIFTMTKIPLRSLMMEWLLSDSLFPLQLLNPVALHSVTFYLSLHWNDTPQMDYFTGTNASLQWLFDMLREASRGLLLNLYGTGNDFHILHKGLQSHLWSDSDTLARPTLVSSFNRQNWVLHSLQWWLTISLIQSPLHSILTTFDLYFAANASPRH